MAAESFKEFGKGTLDDQPLFFPVHLKRPE